MKQKLPLKTEPLKKATRLNKRSKIITAILAAIESKKGENILSIDLKKLPEAVSDYFIICEANNTPQLRAIADEIEEKIWQNCKEKPYRREGAKNMQWLLLDYVNVVVHIMHPDTRKFYKLEELWSDGILLET